MKDTVSGEILPYVSYGVDSRQEMINWDTGTN